MIILFLKPNFKYENSYYSFSVATKSEIGNSFNAIVY